MPLPDFDALPVVHTCITIYHDDTTALAEFSRPQDWGNPRWQYRVYRISAPDLGYTCVFHCRISAQLNESEHLQTFAPMFHMILLPGSRPEECGRDFLREDDFWDPAWGELPAFLEDDDLEYEE